MPPYIWQFVSAHAQAIGIALLYALVAAISTMPAPGATVSLYEWFYDWTHTLINVPSVARFHVPAPVPHPLPDPQSKGELPHAS